MEIDRKAVADLIEWRVRLEAMISRALVDAFVRIENARKALEGLHSHGDACENCAKLDAKPTVYRDPWTS